MCKHDSTIDITAIGDRYQYIMCADCGAKFALVDDCVVIVEDKATLEAIQKASDKLIK